MKYPLCALLLLAGSAQAQYAPSPVFLVHGTPRRCNDITQLDRALSVRYQPFFAGWTLADYDAAIQWATDCSQYGWQTEANSRIPTLQSLSAPLRPAAQPITPPAVAVSRPTSPASPPAHSQVREPDGYQSMSVRNFVIDGPTLAAQHAKVRLVGSYLLSGNVGVLYADSQAVIMARYQADVGRQPSVPLLTEDASHKLREVLLSCDSNPSTGQVGCQIEIHGHATMCTLSNTFGAAHNTPCLEAEDGSGGATPGP